jgi:hypothetical protein
MSGLTTGSVPLSYKPFRADITPRYASENGVRATRASEDHPEFPVQT